MELHETIQINQGFLPTNNIRRSNNMQDLKSIIKTWSNRLPVLADDLSHWNDTWQQHHYQFVINYYDNQQDQ